MLSASATGGDPGTITSLTPFTGVLRLVKLNDPSHEKTIESHASVYATAVKTDYSFDGDTAILSFTWTVQGLADQLLMMSWPHHRSVENGP